jgi:hypothetical protein
MDFFACFDELSKLGAVSDEQAEAALRRLDTLERNKTTPGRVARYAAIGATAAPAIGAVGSVISGQNPFKGLSHVGKIRHVAAQAATGALGAGAIPVIQGHLDRKGEEKVLKKYLKERGH